MMKQIHLPVHEMCRTWRWELAGPKPSVDASLLLTINSKPFDGATKVRVTTMKYGGENRLFQRCIRTVELMEYDCTTTTMHQLDERIVKNGIPLKRGGVYYIKLEWTS